MNIVKPDYNRSVLSISSSIMKYYNVDSNYNSLKELDDILNKEYRNIVYLIIDGMGAHVLKNNMEKDSLLRSNLVTEVTSVFPPTTAAATISIHSGISPYESGWVGWMPYFKEDDCMIEVFSGKNFYTREQVEVPLEYGKLKYKTIYEMICEKNKKVDFNRIFPDFVPNGAKSFDELCDNIKNACNNEGNNLISAYWTEPDSTIHHFGVDSIEVKKVLESIDERLKKLKNELNDTLIIITADHGAVNINEVYLNEIPEIDECLKRPPSIEARFVSFFIKDGMHEQFVESLNKHFNGKFILYTKEEFLDSGILGRGIKHERIDDYIGDYIFISTSDLAISYTVTGINDEELVANHGGMTDMEMLVPVICIEC